MIFIHYADDYPLYTYAVYSPLTKKVLMRQDCIFLPTLFPMRAARSAAGMDPGGEPLVPFRSPSGIRAGSDPAYSFDGWSELDPLPEYIDHVHGYGFTRPRDDELVGTRNEERSPNGMSHYPFHPSFGVESVVAVKVPPKMGEVNLISQSESMIASESQHDADSGKGGAHHWGGTHDAANRGIICTPVTWTPWEE
jgi:hypothetical protein